MLYQFDFLYQTIIYTKFDCFFLLIGRQVAPFKQLAGGVEFIKEIPKSASGKILRRTLRDGSTSFTSR